MITKADLNLDQAIRKCWNCGKESILDLKKVRLGVVAGETKNPNLTHLPPCTCGANEAINRTFADSFVGAHPSPGHLMANVLSAYLRTKGRVQDDLKLQVASETQLPIGAKELSGVTKFTLESLHDALLAAQT
jgi:hypothetical protein